MTVESLQRIKHLIWKIFFLGYSTCVLTMLGWKVVSIYDYFDRAFFLLLIMLVLCFFVFAHFNAVFKEIALIFKIQSSLHMKPTRIIVGEENEK